jgi:hypothetical protein
MEQKGLVEEVRGILQQYRLMLSPGTYLFAPEVQHGKPTGKIIEARYDNPAPYVYPTDLPVVLGFFPLGFVPDSMKGAPPSWLSGYPYLSGLEKLAEAPKYFLEGLKRHVEKRMQVMQEAAAPQPAEQWPLEESAPAPDPSP